MNAFWTNQSFHNYADYAMGEEFRAALARLHARGRARRCAIMCAETLWWRCHRRIIEHHYLHHPHTMGSAFTSATTLVSSGPPAEAYRDQVPTAVEMLVDDIASLVYTDKIRPAQIRG